jgi:5-methylcytosine-specific restriction endonuclease McrA
MAADKQCAYCDEQVDGQPDPDHVIPLSRGGRNDIGNIVACCRLCNSDKSDLTLDEWALERIRLGKRPLRYVLDHKDPRFMHLTLNTASGIAWRHLTDA